MGKFQDGSVIGRCAEQHGIERRWLRRVALQVIANLPPQCNDTEAAREAWVHSARTAIDMAQIACAPGTTPTRYYPMARNSEWSRFLQANANLAPTRWTTVHDAKGSEHLAICLVVPPDRGHGGYTAQLVEAWETRAELESKRVIYVGATRAQKLLAIAVPMMFCDRVAAILRASNVPFEIHNLPVAVAVGGDPVEMRDA